MHGEKQPHSQGLPMKSWQGDGLKIDVLMRVIRSSATSNVSGWVNALFHARVVRSVTCEGGEVCDQ